MPCTEAAEIAIWAEVGPDWTIGKTDAKTVSRETWRRALLKIGSSDESALELLLSIYDGRSKPLIRLYDDVRPFVDPFIGRSPSR